MKPSLFSPPESSRSRGFDHLDAERLPKLVYAVLARRTTGVSFPVCVDSVEASYIGCFEDDQPRRLHPATSAREDDPRHRLGREDDPLRRATLRSAASTFLPLHGASSGNGTILVWLINCDVILWCGRKFLFSRPRPNTGDAQFIDQCKSGDN